VKSEGDGFMVAFQSARRGLECAIAIQRALEERNRQSAHPSTPPASAAASAEDSLVQAGPSTGSGRTDAEAVRVRMGLHSGEAIKEGEDFFGKNVILAARIAAQAKGGEVLVSGVLKALVAGSDMPWGEPRSAELKGLSGEHEIWPVVWKD